jgi:hypothetical protein
MGARQAFTYSGFFSALAYILNSELGREKMWSRIHLIPLLTAEEDRDLVRRHYADLAREKELLGSTTAVYNSDRYVNVGSTAPAYTMLSSGKMHWQEDMCRKKLRKVMANIRVLCSFVRPTYAVTPAKVSK